jgi:hypothetical protein
MSDTWLIMHGERCTAQLNKNGLAQIRLPDFMPYDLWLEEADDIDTRVNNIGNFNYWCAARVLTLDRKYAKEILNSIGAMQGRTDKERAQIALSYHCLTLTDIYWIKDMEEDISFSSINLYDNHLTNAFVDLSLRGRSMTVENAHLIADNASTSGVFPKAWLRKEGGFYLLKDGAEENVRAELLASKIARCFDCHQVEYEEDYYDDALVSSCRIVTDKAHSIATREAFEIYAANHDIDPIEEIIRIDAHGYYMMNIIDYLVGNTDRHWGNWGFFVDNLTGRPIRLHDLMDFNQSFKAYDTVDGALCQTTLPRHISQRQAAIEAVREIGLNQIREIDYAWFGDRKEEAEMLRERIKLVTSG